MWFHLLAIQRHVQGSGFPFAQAGRHPRQSLPSPLVSQNMQCPQVGAHLHTHVSESTQGRVLFFPLFFSSVHVPFKWGCLVHTQKNVAFLLAFLLASPLHQPKRGTLKKQHPHGAKTTCAGAAQVTEPPPPPIVLGMARVRLNVPPQKVGALWVTGMTENG